MAKCSVCKKRCSPAFQIAGKCRFCKKQYCMRHVAAAGADGPGCHRCSELERRREADTEKLNLDNPGGGAFRKVDTI